MSVKWEDLTPKQQEAMKKLRNTVFKRSFLFSVGQGFLLLLLNVLNVIVNALTFQSQGFLMFISLASTVLVVSNLLKWPATQKDEIEASIKKILEDK